MLRAMQIFALWCHPRSMSTAFERVMRERGDVDVMHEPFMYEYYLNNPNRVFADFTPDPDHPKTYAAIRDMILTRAQTQPVFFKDMAYYVLDHLPGDPDFMAAAHHAFLIRDPAESILSYHRRDPGFTCEEVGIEAQSRLFEALRAAGQSPLVIRASDVRAAPEAQIARYCAAAGLRHRPAALNWDSSLPKGWETVQDWHGDVIKSGAIRPPETGRDFHAELAMLGPPYTDYDTHHRPFFEALDAQVC